MKLRLSEIRRNTLIKSTGVYLTSRLFKSAVPFLLLPILTHHLTTADFGKLSMFQLLVQFSLPFVGMNLSDALARRFYYEDDNFAGYTGNCYLIVLVNTLIVSLIFVSFGSFLSDINKIPASFVYIIPFYCFLSFFSESILSIWQVREQPFKFGIFGILITVVEFLVAILFIIVLRFDWTGRVYSGILTSSFFAVVAIFLIIKGHFISFKFDWSQIKHALNYGGGLIPHAIGAGLLTLTSRFILTDLAGVEETGRYTVGFQIASILSFITLSFNYAFVPWLFRKLSLKSLTENIKIVKLTYQSMAIIFVLGGLLAVSYPLLFGIFVDKSFAAAKNYFFWLIPGFCFQGCYFLVTNYISYSEKTYILAIVTLTIGIINIPLNYLLISDFGSIGAAISFSVIYLLYFFVVWFISSKIHKMPWNLKSIN
jgi:O-antigen/teichoic acid export membrane protein